MGKKTKLTSGSGRHVSGRKTEVSKNQRTEKKATAKVKKNFWERRSPIQRTGIVFGCVALLAALIILVAFASIKSTIKPPDILSNVNVKDPTVVTPPDLLDDPNVTDAGGDTVVSTGRKDGFYTILLMGQNYGLTDVMMVAGFDTVNHKIEVVSIPRDTYTEEVRWPGKINGAYNGGGIEKVYSAIEGVIGFRPDRYMLIDYDGFVKLIDTIGGVEFNVPARMYHVDDNGKVDINLQKGYQLLNGRQALGLVRTRSVYDDADLGRIRTTQKFLVAAAQKAKSTISIEKIGDYAGIVVDYVKTDLTGGEIIWFMQQAFSVDMENDLNFHTPEYDLGWNGASVLYLRADNMAQLVNTTINPYTRYFRVSDLNIYNSIHIPSDKYLPDGVEDNGNQTDPNPTTIPSSSGSGAVSTPSTRPSSSGGGSASNAQATPKPTASNSGSSTGSKPAGTGSGLVSNTNSGSGSHSGSSSDSTTTSTPEPLPEPSDDEEPSDGNMPTEVDEPDTSENSDSTDEPQLGDDVELEPSEEPTEEPFVPATPEH